MHEDAGETGDSVLSPAANQLLGLAWIVLFAGRWIVVPLLLAARVLSPSMVAEWDDQILMRLYLVLLAVTLMVVVLRVMRGASRKPAANPDVPAADASAAGTARSVSLDAAGRRPKSGD